MCYATIHNTMKITQEKPPEVFKPIVITIETSEEREDLIKNLQKAYNAEIFLSSSACRELLQGLYDLKNGIK